MSERRGHSEKRFDWLCFSPKHEPQRGDDLPGGIVSRGARRTVFHPTANPSAGQQPARLQRPQILAGSGQRQLQVLGRSGDGLTWSPDRQSEDLQAFAVSENAAGAPKGRLMRRPHSSLYAHFAKCATWSCAGGAPPTQLQPLLIKRQIQAAHECLEPIGRNSHAASILFAEVAGKSTLHGLRCLHAAA